MSATVLSCTSDDIYVVPTVCVLADSKEKDITYFHWCYFQIALIHSWGEKHEA